MKKETIKLIVTVLRYLVPAIIGWLEGDTHAIAEALSALVMSF